MVKIRVFWNMISWRMLTDYRHFEEARSYYHQGSINKSKASSDQFSSDDGGNCATLVNSFQLELRIAHNNLIATCSEGR
jgi:hypothetical protein